MKESNPKVLIYSGTNFSVIRLRNHLEEKGIPSMVENDIAAGLSAGFGGGTESTIRLFVPQNYLEEAIKVVEDFNR